MPAPTHVTLLNHSISRDHIASIHRAGCKDIPRDRRDHGSSVTDYPTLADALADYIDGEMVEMGYSVEDVKIHACCRGLKRPQREADERDQDAEARAEEPEAEVCTTCNRPAGDGYVNIIAGEACLDPIHGWTSREARLLSAAEERVVEIRDEIETARAEQGRRGAGGLMVNREDAVDAEPIEDYRRRMAAWRERWAALFAELRATEKAIADLSPLTPAEARDVAGKTLAGRADEVERLAHDHGMGPGYYREAAALRKLAAVFADDGSSPYRIIVKDDQAIDLAAELIGQGIPQGKAHRIARAVADR